LSQAGAEVCTAANGEEGLLLLPAHEPNLVILEVMMPGMDGWQVCSRIRQVSNVPIVFLTAKDAESDIIQGLRRGAVDYVTKPFSPTLLVARVGAILRQIQLAELKDRPAIYNNSHLNIDLEARQVLVHGRPVKLSTTEHRLLAFLLDNADRPVTFQRILDEVWGPAYEDCIDLVYVYMSRLRRKLEEDPKKPQHLLTEHGLGYRFQT
jgi:DNA-binding response OmpR family regulator